MSISILNGTPRIPILREKDKITREYIEELSQAIESDGCTGCPDIFHECCIIHDLGYRFDIDPWGKTVTRDEVDAGFKNCMCGSNWFGKICSLWRYPAVRILGKWFDKKEVPPFDIYIFSGDK